MYSHDVVSTLTRSRLHDALRRTMWRLPLPVTISNGVAAAMILYKRGNY